MQATATNTEVISPQHLSSVLPRPCIRAALLKYVLSEKKVAECEIKTNSIIRKNRFTHLPEKYTTERKTRYKSSELIRNTDIWCRLRGMGEGNLIRDYRKRIKQIAEFCDCSVSKLRYSLKALHDMGWLHIDDYCISVTSEKKVYGLCGIDHNRKNDPVFFKPDKIKNEKQKHYWLYVADISDNRHRQAYSFTKNLLNTCDINARLWIKSYLMRNGYNVEQTMGNADVMPKLMKTVYLDSFTQQKEDEIHDFLVENRPDTNRSVYGMAEAWNCSPQSVSDIKKQLKQRDLAIISKIGTISSAHWARNGVCHRITRDGVEKVRGHLWNRKTKETFQAVCDDIVPRIAEKPRTGAELPDFGRLVGEALDGRAAA